MTASNRSRLVEWTDPAAIFAAYRSGKCHTGLDLLQAMVDGEIPAPPIAALLDYGPTSFEPGRAVFEHVPNECTYNPLGVVHGGVAATLLDTVMACAIHTLLPIQTAYTTLELKINYVRPITVDTGRVEAIGQVLHQGKRTALAEGKLVDSRGKLLAHGSTTCLLLAD